MERGVAISTRRTEIERSVIVSESDGIWAGGLRGNHWEGIRKIYRIPPHVP